MGIPAEGFRKIDEEVSPSKGIKIIVKRNNSVLYLLIKALQKIEALETKVERIEASFLKASKENPQSQDALDRLIQEVQKIKIAERDTTPPVVTRKMYFFKNPQEIFNSEKAKLAKSKSQ